MMNSIEEYVTQVLEEVRKNNPYPESVFIPPTKKQFAEVHKLLKREGWSLTALSGAMGRLTWNNCIDEISKQMLRE